MAHKYEVRNCMGDLLSVHHTYWEALPALEQEVSAQGLTVDSPDGDPRWPVVWNVEANKAVQYGWFGGVLIFRQSMTFEEASAPRKMTFHYTADAEQDLEDEEAEEAARNRRESAEVPMSVLRELHRLRETVRNIRYQLDMHEPPPRADAP